MAGGDEARCGQSMSTTVPNFVTVSQLPADLLRFVEKFKMTASAQSRREFGVNRSFTFQDIAILKLKNGLKRLFRSRKFTFFLGGGVNP